MSGPCSAHAGRRVAHGLACPSRAEQFALCVLAELPFRDTNSTAVQAEEACGFGLFSSALQTQSGLRQLRLIANGFALLAGTGWLRHLLPLALLMLRLPTAATCYTFIHLDHE